MNRSPSRILASVMAEPIWPVSRPDDFTDDQHGHQRYRAADEAASHLAAMPTDRRAQLEKEWNDG